MQDKEMERVFKAMEQKGNFKEIFNSWDTNQDGKVSFEEFSEHYWQLRKMTLQKIQSQNYCHLLV